MAVDIFQKCNEINQFLIEENDLSARNELIKLLDHHKSNEIIYSPLVNHLIRETGLYPYIQTETADWSDRFIYEAFKVDIGKRIATLHREQSMLLKDLVNGKNIAVSAPTSFGKSFVIDAFIAKKNPKNVVIIVPTLALTDETRRRLFRKFSDRYKIITTSEVELGEQNILIFPQERAIGYSDKLESIDLLIVDEFYKASSAFESSERSSILIKAIMKLNKISKQRYYLAPNISKIQPNAFTNDMEFKEFLNFHTVYLEKHEIFKEIGDDQNLKAEHLVRILSENKKSKTLIYAGTYSQIDTVASIILDKLPASRNKLLNHFREWLSQNYQPHWQLTNLISRSTGIHNGQMHRSLSQIQIRLFEEENGLNKIISTSSIIEGVNTSAENVILWRNRNGRSRLNDFTYKNIIGRSGRMFRHFIGKIYILEEPPNMQSTQLEIPFPDELLGEIQHEEYDTFLSDAQIAQAISTKQKLEKLIGKKKYNDLIKKNILQLSNSDLIYEIAKDLIENVDTWNGLSYLNSENPNSWDRFLYKFMTLIGGSWEIQHRKFVKFVKILSGNWQKSIPILIDELDELEIKIDTFFKLERQVTFKLAAIVNDTNELQKVIHNNGTDISPFLFKISHAFLPTIVYQLEEYGLPRMISKKIHANRILNLEEPSLTIHGTIKAFKDIGLQKLASKDFWHEFDRYILKYFYDGITLEAEATD